MSNQNKAQKQMIADIKDTFFEIPPYQRLYEWGKDEIETLLDDMKKAYDESKEQYFIGNITTSIDKDDSNKFILIDGQQRLTTLWFIGFYLASREYEWEKEITKRVWQEFILKGDKLRIAIPIRDKEREALESLAKKIQKHNKEEKLEISKDLQGIHKKIIDAFGCIESWFNENFSKDDNKKEIDFERLNCFAIFIYTKVCFVFVELAPNTDLNRFFVRMNNRGKQLEKHEILKARILDKIKDDKEWQKYAKIWDLCSDMNKYIFQSASDRNIFEKENKDKETPDKVESIIDFPTFLLHCYKLWVAKKCNENEIPKEITITKDRLLEIMWDNQANKGKNKEVILDGNFIFNIKNDTNRQAKENCKEFIESMLRYRVLFDYFVIKDDVRARSSNNYKIMRLNEYKDNYSLPENSKKGELTSGVLHDLVMIQNYLRVARQGDRQNYHHWLTPFLQFLHKSELINYDCIKPEMWNPNEICKIFAKNDEGKQYDKQDDLVKFLKVLDTNLAIAQLSNKELLDESNKAIKEAQNYKPTETPANIDFDSLLNNGTGTPHYWFYRLEYYLWKDRENEKYAKVIFDNKSFKDIANKFYFRNLNSVEHIEPQSNFRADYEWTEANINHFGNLALISPAFNSQLNNQSNKHKALDLRKKIDDGNAESLKLWLVYALYIKDSNEWTYTNAQAHQEQMLDILIKSLS